MDAQMKKGVLEMCILIQLSKQDMYGYEIMKIIRNVFPDVYDGSIYTILRRMRAEGHAETYMKDIPSGGPSRKYYGITVSGREYCRNSVAEWEKMVEGVRWLMKSDKEVQ